MQQERHEEVFTRVDAWREQVVQELGRCRVAEAVDLSVSDFPSAVKLLERTSSDATETLKAFRKIINAAFLEKKFPFSDRRRVLELCHSVAQDRDAGDLSFASLLYEPLEDAKLTPLVHELLHLPQEALNYCDFEVALYLIQVWDGSLITFPNSGSYDLLRTVRKACLRRGNADSGNAIFQNLKLLLWQYVVKDSLPKSIRSPVFSVNLFPLLSPTATSRDALCGPKDEGFTAYISLPEFPSAIRDSMVDIWQESGQMRSQSERRNLFTPSSSSPSQWHQSQLPHSGLQIDFLACGCAWVFEIGRNHLKLSIVDSDGSIDKDTVLVSATADVSSFAMAARNTSDGYRFVFPPSTHLHVPSYLRAGPSSVQIPQCFPYELPFYPSNNEVLHRELSGFDDAKLLITAYETLSIRLHVRVEMQRKTLVPLLVPQGNRLSTSVSEESSSHRRSRSVPVVRVTEPEPNTTIVRAEPPSNSSRSSPLIFAREVEAEGSEGVDTHKDQIVFSRSELPTRPTPPPSYEEVTLMSANLPDTYPAQSAAVSRPRSRSDVGTKPSSSSHIMNDQRGSHSVRPVVNAPRPIRPLPKPPTLSIDTQNILPSHISTPQRPLKELTPLDVPSPRREGGGPGPSSSPSTATYGTTAIPSTTPRGTSNSPQYTLPNVPPLFLTPSSESKISAGNSGTAISDRGGDGVGSQSTQAGNRKKVSSSGNAINLDSWRSTILYELEETHSIGLPESRTPSSSSTAKLSQLYPFTSHYGLQYLIWLGKQDSANLNGTPTAHSLKESIQSWQSLPLLKAVANYRKVRECLSEVAQLAERQRRANRTDLSWDLVLRHSLKRDVDDLARLTTILVGSESNLLQEVIQLSSAEISQFMDLLQSFIDRRIGSHRQLERFLQKIVNVSGQLPKYLFISGVRRLGGNPIGGGGFADVWEGEVSNRRVALKVIRIFGLASPLNELHQDFCKEAMLWRQFHHQNVLPFYGVCTDEFSPQLAMVSPWMENGDVVNYLKRAPSTCRTTLILGIALGLQYLHDLRPQVVHGDLRAANILVDRKGRPKLADFGLSKIVDSQATTVARQSFNGKGAMRWQAPELLSSTHFPGVPSVVTTCSDIYAFASVCLEVFTEEVPFAHLRDGSVVVEVVLHDKRPPRPPEPAFQRGLNDKLWDLMQLCWLGSPVARPTADAVVEVLSSGRP